MAPRFPSPPIRSLDLAACRELSDDELDRYIEFLRTDVSQKFYAVLGYSVGAIMEKSMSKFGQELASRPISAGHGCRWAR